MSMHRAERIFDGVMRGLWFLSAVLLIFCIGSVTFDVTLRTISRSFSFPWVVELNEYALFGITFFAAAWCLRAGAHVKVDFVLGLLSQKVQTLLAVVSSALSAMACFVFAVCAASATWMSFEQGSRLFKFLRTPKYVFTAVMCISCILLTLEFIRQGGEHFRVWKGLKNIKISLKKET